MTRIREETIHSPGIVAQRIPVDSGCGAPLRQIGIRRATIFTFPTPYLIARRGRAKGVNTVLLIPFEGAQRIETDGGSGVIRPGQFACVPVTVDRRLEAVECDAYRGIHLYVPESGPLYTPDFRIGGCEGIDVLARIAESLHMEFARHGESSQVARGLADALAQFIQRAVSPPDGKVDPYRARLQTLWADVRRDLAHSWSVVELARLANVSPVQLYRIVRRHFDAKPMEMISRLRIEHACALLAHTDFKLDAIASIVGYSSAYSLSNAFARQMGMRPGQYRRAE